LSVAPYLKGLNEISKIDFEKYKKSYVSDIEKSLTDFDIMKKEQFSTPYGLIGQELTTNLPCNELLKYNNSMNEKKFIRNGKKSYFKDDDHLRMVWWLFNAEQLEEQLSEEEIEEINQYIRKEKDPNLWEI